MKKTNIFYGNQFVEKFECDGRRYTKQQIKAIKRRRFMRKLKITLWIIVIVFIIAQVARYSFPNRIIVVEEKKILVDNLGEKISQLKQQALTDLRDCERAGYSEEDGLVIFDTNKKASIGTYQFQKDTVIYYYKSLYGKVVNGKEAILIALDDEKAGQLAHDIIFTTDNGYKNWLNCSNKKGLTQTLAIINKIK